MIGIFRIAKNSSLVLIARATDVLSSILIAGILARYLGVGDYGNYLFIMGLVLTTTALAHMGLPQILVREMSQDIGAMPKFIRCGLVITGASLVLTTLLIFSIGAFSSWNYQMFFAVSAALLSESMVLISGPFISAFISIERMEYDALVTVTNRLVLIGLLMGFVSRDLGFISIFLAMAIANFLRLSAILFISKRLNILPARHMTRADLTYLLRETLPVGVSFILTQLYLYTNLFLLKILRDPEEVALFQAPFSIILKLQILPVILIVAFAPVMARLATADDAYKDLRAIYLWLIKHLFIVCLPLAALGVFLAKDIVLLIFGADFLAASLSFQILIWIVGFYFLNIFSDKILQVIFKQRLLIISSGITFSVNVLLSFIFISGYGYVGGSIATLISTAILFLTNFFFVAKYLKNMSLSFMVKPLAAFVSVTTAFYAARDLNMAILFPAGIMTYFLMLLMLKTFSRSELSLFLTAVNRE
ncbi:MAG: hypothetical protein QG552_2968 [Thermodesulfobacteriota bacterium]|nr:hypothetical protein [Thermodesulfobacteriota bacterium]